MGSVIAAGTSYATHGTHMIPVYVFYSMFGWQRTGDQMWALGDQLGRGFLLGATAGRTTLTGEGLQHNDGHSLLLASVSEACVSYDPAWAYEVAVITKDALRRMYDSTPEHPDGENIFYYLTVYNEPYPQPAGARGWRGSRRASCAACTSTRPASAADGRRRGAAARLRRGDAVGAARAAAARRGLGRRGGRVVGHLVDRAAPGRAGRASRTTCCTPGEEPRVPYVTSALCRRSPGPVVAVSDWIRAVPDQISRWVPGLVHVAGHRRVRLLRHPAGRAPVLPRGRGVDHAGGARRSWRGPARWTRRCPPRRSRSTSWTCRCRRRSVRPGGRRARGRPRCRPILRTCRARGVVGRHRDRVREDARRKRQAAAGARDAPRAGAPGDGAADRAVDGRARHRGHRGDGRAAAVVQEDVRGEPVVAGAGGAGWHRRVRRLDQAPGTDPARCHRGVRHRPARAGPGGAACSTRSRWSG